MTIFSTKDLEFFHTNGYCIVKNSVPQENLDAAVEAIWQFANVSPGKPDQWYHKPFTKIGFLELRHHQALWNNRQYPRIYQAFSELWETEKLWVSIDCVCAKLPQNPKYKDWNHQGFIHWDINPWKQPISFSLQGVLALEDTTIEQGGFQCIPSFVGERLQYWLAQHPLQQELRVPIRVRDLEGLEIKPIATEKGDLIIWKSELAHGNGANTSTRPRLAQYITMFPAELHNVELKEKRICNWKKSLAPVNIYSSKEKSQQAKPSQLTDLGKKLVGLADY